VKNLVKFGHVVFEVWVDGQTDTLITVFHAPLGAK